jgi:plasmid stability protein
MPDLTLRGMSTGVHEALKEAAERNHRSLNGEVLARLEASVRPTPMDVDTLLARVRARKTRLGSLELQEDGLRALKDQGRA